VPDRSLFVDTSGWADPVLRNTPDHPAMEAFYRRAITDQRELVTTNYILAELIALLTARARMPRDRLLAVVDRLRKSTRVHIVQVDSTIDEQAWLLLHQHMDKAWSLADAASFVVMRQRGITEAFTSDLHFIQAGFVRLP
jgi:uncharacterized protein